VRRRTVSEHAQQRSRGNLEECSPLLAAAYTQGSCNLIAETVTDAETLRKMGGVRPSLADACIQQKCLTCRSEGEMVLE